MNPAFTQSNGLKAGGLHMFAIGVGAALTNDNSKVRLRAISGPKAFPEHPLLGADYTAISDFRQLEEALATIGRALCSVRVRVTKLVDEEGDGTYAPANGWNFTGTVTAAGTPNYRWLVPGKETGPPSGGNTRPATTADDFTGDPGRAAFVWKPIPTAQTSQIVLTDAGKSGYHFVDVDCSKNGTSIDVENAATITLTNLAITDYVDCVFRNQRNTGKLKVEKRFSGQPVEVSLLIDGKTEAKSADASFDTGFVTVDVGTHGVSEEFTTAAHAALFESRYVCAAGGVVLKQGDGVQVTGGIEVSNGASVVCTFTNTRKSLSVAVAKDADPGSVDQPGGEVRFTVAVVNRTHAAVTVSALRDNVFGDLDKDSPAASHTWTASNCDAGVPLAAYDGTVGGADTYTCRFVADVTGAAGTTHRDTVTATITDASGQTASEEATAKVEIVDVRPSISVTKTTTPSVVQNSGLVTFTAVITNTSPVDALLVDQLTDSILGDLIRGPGQGVLHLRREPGDPAAEPSDRRELHLHVPRDRLHDRDRHRHRLGHRPRGEPRRRRCRSARDRPGDAGARAARAARAAVPARAESRAESSGSALSAQVGSGHRVPRRRGASIVRVRDSGLEHDPRTESDPDGHCTSRRDVHEDHRPSGTGRVLDRPCRQAADVHRLPGRRAVVRHQGSRLRDGQRRDDDHEHGRRYVQARVGRAVLGQGLGENPTDRALPATIRLRHHLGQPQLAARERAAADARRQGA